MKYAIYQLNFSTGVHFGEGILAESNSTFQADTLFSALCHEILKLEGENGIYKLVDYVKKGNLRFSDSMPYIGTTYYLPKPVIKIENTDTDSSMKKQVKKLKYVSVDHYQEFLKGELDISAELNNLEYFGKSEIRTNLNQRDDTGPYQVGIFHYGHDAGIYIIVAYSDDDILDMVEELLYSVGYEGIGGKKSSGLGKFEPVYKDVPKELLNRLENFEKYPHKITLSVSLPKKKELENVLAEASYGIILRSGFIASETYADHFRKKQDLFCLKAGSCVKNIFEGDIFDVSSGGNHPVYRYAKPLFLGVEI